MRSVVFAAALGLSFVPQMALAQSVAPRTVAPVVTPRTNTVPVVVNEVRPVAVVRAPVFGRPHHWIVGGATSFSINGAHEANHGNHADGFSIGLAPKAGYFVNDTLVLGGRINTNYNQSQGQKLLNVAVGPTIAAHVPINERVSLLPELSAVYGYNLVTGGGLTNALQGQNVTLRLELTGVIHLAPHVSATISPLVEQTVMNKSQVRDVPNSERALGSLTRYGAQVGVLVWL